MKNLKNAKGITLVALVVTIIVLLILAGVSLSLVSGSDGVITKASGAADTNAQTTARERLELRLATDNTTFLEKKYAGGNRQKAEYKTFLTYLAQVDAEWKVSGTSGSEVQVDDTFKAALQNVSSITADTTEASIKVTGTGLGSAGYTAKINEEGKITDWQKNTATTPDPDPGS